MKAEDQPTSLFTSQSEENLRREFEQVYYDHAAALFRYGAQFQASPTLVEDCVQELFADLWEKKDTLAFVRSLRSYLLGALRRKILRETYATKEQPVPAEALFALSDHWVTAYKNDANALPEETIEQLANALNTLTDKQQEVLYLRFYNQLSFSEIAQIMSVQTRTVYKLCRRAITTLNAYLSKVLRVVPLLSWMLFFLL